MAFDDKKRKQRESLNKAHTDNPKVGDYWQEMLQPILLVIDVTPLSVSFLKKRVDVGKDHWTWDTSEYETLSRPAFAKYVRYEGELMKDKTWCDVIPNSARHQDFIDEMKRHKSWKAA